MATTPTSTDLISRTPVAAGTDKCQITAWICSTDIVGFMQTVVFILSHLANDTYTVYDPSCQSFVCWLSTQRYE